MRAVLLAGGKGTRLYPATNVVSKQLLPVYDKPMVYYPLSTLLLAGIREIALISTPEDLPLYKNLLGDGSNLGIKISYFEQTEPRGLADAFLVCEDFIGNENVTLILGDNVFYGDMKLKETFSNFTEGATIFGYTVKKPERYGVLNFDSEGRVKEIVEKPSNPPSNYAVPGLYLYDQDVVEHVKSLSPSPRGELEITDLNNIYINKGNLSVKLIGRGVAWLDAGKAESLVSSSNFIMSVEKRQNYKIACIEEICFRQGYIDYSAFLEIIEKIPPSDYRDYLSSLKSEFKFFSKK